MKTLVLPVIEKAYKKTMRIVKTEVEKYNRNEITEIAIYSSHFLIKLMKLTLYYRGMASLTLLAILQSFVYILLLISEQK